MSSDNNSSSGSRKKKITATAAAVILAVTLMIGGTFSYLQSSSDEVVNEFSTNNIDVDIDETGDGEYNIIPGTSETKDPTVTLTTSVDAYVFLVVEDNTEGLVEYEIDTDVWTKLEIENCMFCDDDYSCSEDCVCVPWTGTIYYKAVSASDDEISLNVLEGQTVSYSSSLTNEDMYDYTTTTDENGDETTTATLKSGITLTFQAYAIQAEPFYSNTYDEESGSYDKETAATNAWYAVYYGITSSVTGNIETAEDEDALEEALEDEETGYVILTASISLEDTLEVDSEVTIDLAGYSITNSSGTALEVTKDGALTITDSPSEESGSVSGTLTSASGQYEGGAITVNGGDLKVEAGTITGTVSDSDSFNAGAVYVGDGGSFEFTGGTISNSSSSSYQSAGAVYVNSSTFTMSGGSITNNTCSSGKGGGIRACSGTYVTITGGTISGNTASSGNNAYIDSGCTLSDNDSILTDYYNGNPTE